MPAKPRNRRLASSVILITACAFVIITWLICFEITNGAFRKNSSNGMDAFGQFGDAFGSINALFTGLALVGLVYTIVLQQRQLWEQERDSKKNGRALLRQSREQFLTARLNAVVALLEAHRARADLANEYWQKYAQEEGARESRKLRQKINIIMCEASFGFDKGGWNIDLEEKAIRSYLRMFLEETHHRCVDHNKKELISNLQLTLENARIDLRMLIEDIGDRHPDLAQTLKDIKDKLGQIKEETNDKNNADSRIKTGAYITSILKDHFPSSAVGR